LLDELGGGGGSGGASIGDEVGEGFRLVTTERGLTAEALDATGVVRWRHPVALTTSWDRDGGAATAALAAAGLGGLPWIGIATRRHGRHALDTFAGTLGRPRLEREAARALPPDTRVLLLAADDRRIYAGVLPRSEIEIPLDPERDVERDVEDAVGVAAQGSLSRAGAKLEEAWDWLAWRGEPVPTEGRWLELGAFPGGMTSVLTRRASHVVAVDRRAAPDAFAHDPRVTWLAADVGELTTEALGPLPFDGLVSDVNGPPLYAARAAAGLARAVLRPGGLVLFTVKLPRWLDHPSVTRAVSATFRENGVTTLGYRHSPAHRQELALAGRREP
jgi:hypothetical protein